MNTEVPAINDTDNNGVADDVDAALAAVEKAEAKHTELVQAIEGKGGVINEADKAALDAIKAELDDLKDTAQGLVTALPDSTAKDGLQGRLDALNTEVPAINDTDGDGIDDTLEQHIEDLMKAAEAAYKKAHEDLTTAQSDKIISQIEHDALVKAFNEAQAAKDAVQVEVDKLATSDGKTDFQDRLDALNNFTVPDITRSDLLAVDNDVQLILNITPSTPTLGTGESFVGQKATSFGVAKIGLGGLADVSALAFGSYLSVNVKENTTRQFTLKAEGGGVSVAEHHDLVVLKKDEWGNWNVVKYIKDWFIVPFLGNTKTDNILIDEPGDYKVFLTNSGGVGVLTGSGLSITDDKVFDYSVADQVSGSISGNILTDINNQDGTIGHVNGKDIYSDYVIIETVNVDSQKYIVNQLGTTTIQGKYGTLILEKNGQYTYTLDADTKPPYGSVEHFTYTLKDPISGETSSANLNITLNKDAVIIDPVVRNLTLDVHSTITTVEKLGNSSQVNIASVGLGIADINVATIETGMTIKVAAGHTREVSFSSDGGAPVGVGVIPVSLAIYKYNEKIQNWELYAFKENWYSLILVVTGGGKSSENIDILFTEGTYKAVTLSSTAGLAVLPTIVLKAESDTLYNHTLTEVSKSLGGDLTIDQFADFAMRSVNDQNVSVNGTTILGKYGSLLINVDGTYQYTVNPNVDIKLGDIETFTYSIKNSTTGELATGTLNIELDIIKADHDRGEAKFGLDNVVKYVEWIVDENTSGSATSTYSHDIAVGKNQIFDLALAYKLSQLGLKADQYLIRIKNKDTGIVTETHLTKTETASESGTWKLHLTEGNYTLEVVVDMWAANVNSVKLNLAGTITTLDGFTAEANNNLILAGDLLKNDTYYDNQISSIMVKGQTLIFDRLDKYEHVAKTTIDIEGEHGVLTLKEDGTYSYKASGVTYGVEKFVYTLNSIYGTSDSAELIINVGKNMTSSQYADVLTGSDGHDSIIYTILDTAGATGGNGTDIWTDFHVGAMATDIDADKIDISALLVGFESSKITTDLTASATYLKNYLGVRVDGDNVTLTLDRDGTGTAFTDKTDLLKLEGLAQTGASFNGKSEDDILKILLQNNQLNF